MDSLLFEEWIKEVDKEMENKGRNITMIIDNCPAHPDVDGLKPVELERLPPNTTSHTQPMDQGVIRSVKAKYRHLSVKRIIRTIEKNGSLPTTSLLDAMTMLARAWDSVEEKTIMNCFRKAGISPGTQTSAIDDDDDPFRVIENDPFSDLQYDLNVLRESQPELVPDDLTAADLVDVDTNVMTNGDHLTDAEIVAEILNDGEQKEEDAETIVEVDDEPANPPSSQEIESAIDTLDRFSLFCDNDDIKRKVDSLDIKRKVDSLDIKRKVDKLGY